MISTLATEEVAQLIEGPAGKLEIVRGKAQGTHRNAWGIICHPHSLHGGTLYNKVVTTLTKLFQGLGLATVRFNFRGVGRSEGQFDYGNGEVDDLLAVIDWVQREKLKEELWLAGFSFGSYVAAKAATQIPVNRLITVAPPVEHFPMATLPEIKAPWILAQGDADEVVPASMVYEWAENRPEKPIVLRFPEASHFFHGKLQDLKARLEETLRSMQ